MWLGCYCKKKHNIGCLRILGNTKIVKKRKKETHAHTRTDEMVTYKLDGRSSFCGFVCLIVLVLGLFLMFGRFEFQGQIYIRAFGLT